MGKKKKFAPILADAKYAHSMKMVTSSSCLRCKKQCERGIEYIEKMSKPGAKANGIPCILTKGKAHK